MTFVRRDVTIVCVALVSSLLVSLALIFPYGRGKVRWSWEFGVALPGQQVGRSYPTSPVEGDHQGNGGNRFAPYTLLSGTPRWHAVAE